SGSASIGVLLTEYNPTATSNNVASKTKNRLPIDQRIIAVIIIILLCR
ncbi:MAG: hypothetical protein ACJASU_002311, partial [Cognaticolwellia sp.]